jgi:hypothetical protein
MSVSLSLSKRLKAMAVSADEAAGVPEKQIDDVAPEPTFGKFPPAVRALLWFLVFIAFLALLVSRRPDVLLYPQLYAEDGKVFYAGAFNNGWMSLFEPFAGYFHAAPRIVALLATAFPLAWGPFITAFAALSIEAGLATFIVSDRLAAQLPSRWLRIAIALVLIGAVNAKEVYGNMANAQWFLAIWMVALLASSKGNKPLEAVWAAICALTGPLSIVVAAMTPFFTIKKPLVAIVIVVGALLQVVCLLTHARTSMPMADPLRPHVLFMAVGGQIGIASIVGTQGYSAVYMARQMPFPRPEAITLALVCLLAVGWINSRAFVRMLIALGVASMVAGLRSPIGINIWEAFAIPGGSERYFFLLGFALVSTIAYLLSRSPSRAAIVVGAVVLLALIAINWSYPPMPENPEFMNFAQAYKPNGQAQEVQIAPPAPNGGWTMTLKR